MKKKNLAIKLSLQKKTITSLQQNYLQDIKGGGDVPTLTDWRSCPCEGTYGFACTTTTPGAKVANCFSCANGSGC
ncbi:class I lanthipeptide [Chitinophaga nivalis]|uniref:Class I lanthipeptide n=1 Tax=Chitinophaga nivalis TaxID=2991709 RepID=A0ABT3IH56_9BACT|nr:class I lanthipeptide [Chitinophaga nivalis]MCW3467025.1 class I lanthipeptide [Chitinophaga nivalis]MCW3483284.1 class I lanthipeptide [Chitinophaga nivalis]